MRDSLAIKSAQSKDVGQMLDENHSIHKWRVLLTETLPYEVPLIFSNETLFFSLVASVDAEQIKNVVSQLRPQRIDATIPYNYQINKDETRKTTLSIIHPLQQMNISEFYVTYWETLVDFCSKSDASLRFPTAINTLTTRAPLSSEATLKTGMPAEVADDDDIEASRISSYFIYKHYTLLSKFLESSDFRRLEKRFKFLRIVDISKCFFNLYTHSLTWAIKGKPFSKKYSDLFSFEGSFDKLMQRCNYNETNGIVVGPEISRIFAEIILQQVDNDLKLSVAKKGLNENYVIRRYVDDYYIFCNSSLDADAVTESLSSHLEKYKLFLNAQKTQDFSRPFISSLSLARSDIGNLIAAIRALITQISTADDAEFVRRKITELRSHIFNVRNVIGRYKISVSSISAWYLSNLRVAVQIVVGSMKSNIDLSIRERMIQVCDVLFEGVFYLCALDFRVRSTYTLCQILVFIKDDTKIRDLQGYDSFRHRVQTELEYLVTSHLTNSDDAMNGSVEIYNALISGAYCFGRSFVVSSEFLLIADRFLKIEKPSYFLYISLKFCLLKSSETHLGRLNALNSRARDRIVNNKTGIFEDSEIYLLLCDYLSSPDIASEEKRALYSEIFGGNKSKTAVEFAGKTLGFADWTGVNVEHLLARKELRPAYD